MLIRLVCLTLILGLLDCVDEDNKIFGTIVPLLYQSVKYFLFQWHIKNQFVVDDPIQFQKKESDNTCNEYSTRVFGPKRDEVTGNGESCIKRS